jgi:hypothetical protein
MEKFRMFGGKAAINPSANVYPILIISGETLTFG